MNKYTFLLYFLILLFSSPFCLSLQQQIQMQTYAIKFTVFWVRFQSPATLIFVTSAFGWIVTWVILGRKYSGEKMHGKYLINSSAMAVISSHTFLLSTYFASLPEINALRIWNSVVVAMLAIFFSQVPSESLHLKTKNMVVTCLMVCLLTFYHLREVQITETGGDRKETIVGFAFVLISISSDAFSADSQSMIKAINDANPIHMFQEISKWCAFLSLLYLIFSGQVWYALSFILDYPSILTDFLKLSIATTINQIAIYKIFVQFKQHIVYLIFALSSGISLFISSEKDAVGFICILTALVIFCYQVGTEMEKQAVTSKIEEGIRPIPEETQQIGSNKCISEQ